METFTQEIRDGSIDTPEGFDTENTLILAFGDRATIQDPGFFAELREALPTARLVGCSTAGHFIDASLHDENPVVVGIRFDRSSLRQATVPIGGVEGSRTAGEKLGVELNHSDLKAVILVSDGTDCDGAELVKGLSSMLPSETVVFGGLAADAGEFVETSVLDGEGVGSGRVTAVGIVGQHLEVSTGSGSGWDPFGPERLVTAAEGAELFELDGESAYELYRRYLGELADELPGSALLFPLAIRPPESDYGDHTVRTVLGADADVGSMTFAGQIPVGWRAQLMRASFDALVDGAADSAEFLAKSGGVSSQPERLEAESNHSICIGVSCVGRRIVLGSRTEEELDEVVAVVGPERSLVGFYSNGEFAPGHSGRCELHNQTMTLLMLNESE